MPETTAFVESLEQVFGAVNVIYAEEGGKTYRQPLTEGKPYVWGSRS